MKNLIEFLLESRGQAIYKRSSNRPYDPKEDVLVKNRDNRTTRAQELKKQKYINKLNSYLKEVNDFINDGGIVFETLELTYYNNHNDDQLPIFALSPLNMDEQDFILYDYGYDERGRLKKDIANKTFDINLPLKLEFSEGLYFEDAKNQTNPQPCCITQIINDIANDDDEIDVNLMIHGDMLDYVGHDIDDDNLPSNWQTKYCEAIVKQYRKGSKHQAWNSLQMAQDSTFHNSYAIYDISIPLNQFNYKDLKTAIDNVNARFWESLKDNKNLVNE